MAASLAAARFAGEASPAPAAAGTGARAGTCRRDAGRVVAMPMRRQCARGVVVRCAGAGAGRSFVVYYYY
uniref:Uncharacterized protein n=1 Tax=Oryza meridionalis TaxID=40149 RepID=A0A0E0D2G1_9ORYZ